MKASKQLFLLLVAFVLSSGLTAQDLSFNMDVTSPKSKAPFVMKVYVSGTKMAMQPQITENQGKMTYVVDNATRKQYMLMDANGQKMAMAVNMDVVEKAMNEVAKEPKVTYTKETKVIDGYKCTKVITETDDHTADLWLTQDVGMQYSDFFKMLNKTKGPQGPVAKIPALTSVKGFPIEISSTDKQKRETVVLKINKISKARIDPKIFSIEGYQVMEAPNMTR